MAKKQELILIDGVDRTASVQSLKQQDEGCRVVFQNSEKEYTYPQERVQVLPLVRRIDPGTVVVTAEGRVRKDLTAILDYGSFYRLETDKGGFLCPASEAEIDENCLCRQKSADRFAYFSALASAVSLKTDEDFNILEHQYRKIPAVRRHTALGSYLSGDAAAEPIEAPELLVYPFGMNRSQKKAVENAFSSRVSLIQGPPGTGKTQTILNILANAVLNGKTVAVVSGNNSATENVECKLTEQKLDFLTAMLGSRAKKEAFLSSQTGKYPSMRGWKLKEEETEALREQVRQLTGQVNRCLGDEIRIAGIRQELLELEPEARRFAAFYDTCPKVSRPERLFLSADRVMALLNEYEDAVRRRQEPGFFRRLELLLRYRPQALRIFREPPEAVIPYLQSEFYRIRLGELEQERKVLESRLRNESFAEKQQALTEYSMQLLKDHLVRRYRYSKPRRIFEPGELTLRSGEFLEEYPMILSTTYSIKSCLSQEVLYDYVIVDEASQVDLATGVAALSCGRNAVIVGDQKQLPNVLTAETVRTAEPFWDPKLGKGYCFSRHSLLSSASAVWKEAPTVLLREHYRCHPAIIEFCNQEFYDGKLLLMTEDRGEADVLALRRTAEDFYPRGRTNQREADVIQREVLPQLRRAGLRDIGVITPYRDQAALLQKNLPAKTEVDTVHKFQGREKEAIVLSTVDQVIGSFVDDEHLLNVAVSRAVRSLTLVTSSDPANDRTHYGDLIRYIRYHRTGSIRVQDSVFAALCRENELQRRLCLKRRGRSAELEAQDRLCRTIGQVLRAPEFRQLDWAMHVSLGGMIRDRAVLGDEAKKALQNPMLCADAVIFRKMDRSPVLVIEQNATRSGNSGKPERKSDRILALAQLPLLRLGTGVEPKKLEAALRKALIGGDGYGSDLPKK